jgi:hypothetical protein
MDLIVVLSMLTLVHLELKSEELLEVKRKLEEVVKVALMLGSST